MFTLESFKSAFKGDIVTPSDSDYDKAISRWANNAARRAKIVAFVKNAEDTSLAVKYAVAEKLPIAIRGGGHSVSGASSSEGGLVVDLSRYMNGVTVDPTKKLAYVGGGALWETVDKKAIEHGLATVGGTVNHTGVGGLTLGGGYGWLSGEHGLSVDNVVQVMMVVADGSILTANKEENADLFWAVRGGGCNFGVCVEFVLRLHEQRRTVFSGVMVFPPPLHDSLFKLTQEWWTKGPSSKEGMVQVFTRAPGPERAPIIVCFPFYNGSEAEGRKAFKAFFDLGPTDQCKEVPYEAMNGLQNAGVPHGINVYMRGVLQSDPRPDICSIAFQKVVELTADDPQHNLALVLEFFPLHTINKISKNAMAYNTRSSKYNVLGTTTWAENTPEQLRIGREKCYEATDLVANLEKDVDEAKTRAYGNYVSDEVASPNRTAKLFGDNYPKLQQLKKKYDPNVIFNKWYPIVPA